MRSSPAGNVALLRLSGSGRRTRCHTEGKGYTGQKEIPTATQQSPTVRRRRLALELRRFRDAAGLTCEEVAEHLECSTSKISRIETGRVSVSPRDVRDMLQLVRRARPTAGQPGATRPRIPAEGLVARVQRRHRAAVRDLHRAGERGLGDPDLRGHADPGAAPDRGLRPRGDRRGSGGRRPGGGGAQRRRPDGPPAHPAHRGPAPVVGGARRGRAAPPGRRLRADADAAGAPAGDEHPAERRHPGAAVRGRARTRPWDGRS